MRPLFKSIAIIFLLFIANLDIFAQLPLKPRSSPLDMASIQYDDTYVKITYSRPHKNGKKIFGDLVPFDSLWKTGDNEATEITTNKKILIGSDTLHAGTYSIFSIPGQQSWTIIFNEKVGLWGDYRYDGKYDVLRLEASVGKTDVIYEPFTIEFGKKIMKNTELYFIWENTKVIIPIEFL